MCVGTIVGLLRMTMDFTFPDPVCGEVDTRPSYVKDVHYLHFAVILATVSATVTVVVTLMTEAVPVEKVG